MSPHNERLGKKRVRISLVALSSAAVLAVYGAGYVRTRAAAERFAEEPVRRRPVVPPAIRAAAPAPTAILAAPPGGPPQVSRTDAGSAAVSSTSPNHTVSTGAVKRTVAVATAAVPRVTETAVSLGSAAGCSSRRQRADAVFGLRRLRTARRRHHSGVRSRDGPSAASAAAIQGRHVHRLGNVAAW